jgi:6-pyruvoyltetrahydropterin/6-carboxytetrahydropterin synthase
MEIFTEVTFEAAHRLPNVANDHKCARLHGHTYRVEVKVEGPVGLDTGWVMDFADLREACEPLRAQLDHHFLNELPGLENPTSENLARWMWERLHRRVPQLAEIVVRESPTSGCRYRGD